MWNCRFAAMTTLILHFDFLFWFVWNKNMDAENVVAKIFADAGAEAEKVKNQAREKQAAEQAALDEQLRQYQKQTDALAQKAAEEEKSHLLAAARMQIAKELLTEKRKILDEVFEQARRQLLNLPDRQYRQVIAGLMVRAVETGNEEVVVDKNENRIDQELVNQVNQRLAGQNKGNLRLSDQRQELGGGFILKRGKIRTNVSFEVLLNQARKGLEIELAKELFEK
jgi:V/A-type H+-transporting ATPase subunit E